MQINLQQASERLLKADNILILAHRRPDGDTLGSAFGLLYALEGLGKTARVECPDSFPETFSYLFAGEYHPKEFTEQFIVAVDVASCELLIHLGEKHAVIDLCIDHHKSNTFYAKETLLDSNAPAAAQLMYQVIVAMGVTITIPVANALYTGIVTDTGCFRFASVTSLTHEAAAKLIELGAEHSQINRRIFESKSRGRMEAEIAIQQSMEFYLDGKCAMIFVPSDTEEKYGVTEDDLDGVSSTPRTIVGVLAGVTVRDHKNGEYRVSLRTNSPVDASAICAEFGGGGHTNAAGCTIVGELSTVKERIINTVTKELERNGL